MLELEMRLYLFQNLSLIDSILSREGGTSGNASCSSSRRGITLVVTRGLESCCRFIQYHRHRTRHAADQGPICPSPLASKTKVVTEQHADVPRSAYLTDVILQRLETGVEGRAEFSFYF